MGLNFSALMKCDPPSSVADSRIAILEQLAPLKDPPKGPFHRPVTWIASDDYSESIERPNKITDRHCLRIANGLHLHFGVGGIRIWHALRFPRFVNDAEIQHWLIATLKKLAELISTDEVVITHDGSPIMVSLQRGASYSEAVSKGVGIEAEVSEIKELYEIVDEHRTCDSHGYWRLKCIKGPADL